LTTEGIEPNPGPRTLKQLEEELKTQYYSAKVYDKIAHIFAYLKDDLGPEADEGDESDVHRWFKEGKDHNCIKSLQELFGKDYRKLLDQLRSLVEPITSNNSRSGASLGINHTLISFYHLVCLSGFLITCNTCGSFCYLSFFIAIPLWSTSY